MGKKQTGIDKILVSVWRLIICWYHKSLS